jgi:hypothetical protein
MLVNSSYGDDLVDDYEQDPDDFESLLQDPFRAGDAADRPLYDPRQNFLDVLSVRLSQVTTEYDRLLDHVSQLRAARGWAVMVRTLITRPIQDLHAINNHCDAFIAHRHWQRYFGGLDRDRISQTALHTIEDTLAKSRLCYQGFLGLRDRLNDFSKEV